MKKFLLVLLILLWPVNGRATLITYDISFTIAGENVSPSTAGETSVRASFVQDTQGDPFFQVGIDGSWFAQSTNGASGGFEASFTTGLGASSQAIGVFLGDPSGNFNLQFLYDTPLGPLPLASVLPVPDMLSARFGVELYSYNLCPPPSTGLCGFSGSQTFARGEFSFTAVPEPGAWLLIGVGLAVCGIVARKRRSR
jgi:hypothetical protein